MIRSILLALAVCGLVCLQGCGVISRGFVKGTLGGIPECINQEDDEVSHVVMSAPHIGISTWLFLTNPIIGGIYVGANGLLCGLVTEAAYEYANVLLN